jgi:hypothetical protein
MAGLKNQIAAALVAEVSGVAGLVATSSTPVDEIPNAPFFYVGAPKGSLVGGSLEQKELHYPLRVVVTRVSSADRDQQTVNDFSDLIETAFQTGISLGIAGVVSAELKTFDTDVFIAVGGAQYQAVDYDCVVTVARPATYTA